jgi:penicillin-binding protein 1C
MKRIYRNLIIIFGVALMGVMVAPMPRFSAPLSTVVEAGDGSLLGARIAADGQWRFPAPDSVPYKFEKALLTYEDRHFYRHPGINPVSLARALVLNIKSGSIVSGGSTLTMQVARLAGGNPGRTYGRKLLEMASAVKLEIFRSKRSILKMYTANAPFGGNVVGLEAAVWKYSGYSPYSMTWADAATYAVLPNSPALVHPGRNRELLRQKRNRLLEEMHRRGFYDSLTLVLSVEEPVMPVPHQLPAEAPHLTDWFHRTRRGERVQTTIVSEMQRKATEIVNYHSRELQGNMIFNAACIIVAVDDGRVLAYVGNSRADTTGEHGHQVDIIRSLRSSGSILKPLLYAGLLTDGGMLPNTLLPDVPLRYPGFAPKNFDGAYNGAVPAAEALSRSLNIPSVRMLQDYSTDRFHLLLAKCGITSFRQSADYYGLSMILGGGEVSLWELTGMYASMSRVLKEYNISGGYTAGSYRQPTLVAGASSQNPNTGERDAAGGIRNAAPPPLSAGAIWLTYNALREVNRPDSESGWQFTGSSPDVAWKTGTSFGFRDAWAVATTPEYVIGVWAGNADGEGRPGLTGVSSAGPVVFDMLSWLSPEGWFERPEGDELTLISVCRESGYRAGVDCKETVEEWVPVSGLKTEACPYHRIIHLNSARTSRVNSSCAAPGEIVSESWFVLPPAMEYFYRRKNPSYRVLPAMAPGCEGDAAIPEMEFIYPPRDAGIFIPRDHTGEQTRFVAELLHRDPATRVFWHLDDRYLGETKLIHQFEIMATEGRHTLTAVDQKGNTIISEFEIRR